MKTEIDIILRAVKADIDKLDLVFMDLRHEEKEEAAHVLQTSVDWIRFRAGCDKECFACRKQNAPESLKCVHCDEVIICEQCASKSQGTAWRCAHGGGLKAREIPAHVRVKEHYAPREAETEKREPKSERAKFVMPE